jgi:hypothetical protein
LLGVHTPGSWLYNTNFSLQGVLIQADKQIMNTLLNWQCFINNSHILDWQTAIRVKTTNFSLKSNPKYNKNYLKKKIQDCFDFGVILTTWICFQSIWVLIHGIKSGCVCTCQHLEWYIKLNFWFLTSYSIKWVSH